jgi:hypothetical protein
LGSSPSQYHAWRINRRPEFSEGSQDHCSIGEAFACRSMMEDGMALSLLDIEIVERLF